MMQRLSASAFSLTSIIPAEGFRIVAGTPVERSLPGSLRHHFFCPECMTLMFTKMQGADARVNMRPTLCDDAGWVVPFVEMMTRHKLAWAQTCAVHSFDGFPVLEEFVDLFDAFADWIEH